VKQPYRPMKPAFVLVLLSAVAITGCNKSQPDSTPGHAKKLTIALMPKSKGNAYFVSCKKGADRAAKDLGVDLIFDGPTDPDPARQNEIIENWITLGVDAIAAACLTARLALTLRLSLPLSRALSRSRTRRRPLAPSLAGRNELVVTTAYDTGGIDRAACDERKARCCNDHCSTHDVSRSRLFMLASTASNCPARGCVTMRDATRLRKAIRFSARTTAIDGRRVYESWRTNRAQ